MVAGSQPLVLVEGSLLDVLDVLLDVNTSIHIITDLLSYL